MPSDAAGEEEYWVPRREWMVMASSLGKKQEMCSSWGSSSRVVVLGWRGKRSSWTRSLVADGERRLETMRAAEAAAARRRRRLRYRVLFRRDVDLGVIKVISRGMAREE